MGKNQKIPPLSTSPFPTPASLGTSTSQPDCRAGLAGQNSRALCFIIIHMSVYSSRPEYTGYTRLQTLLDQGLSHLSIPCRTLQCLAHSRYSVFADFMSFGEQNSSRTSLGLPTLLNYSILGRWKRCARSRNSRGPGGVLKPGHVVLKERSEAGAEADGVGLRSLCTGCVSAHGAPATWPFPISRTSSSTKLPQDMFLCSPHCIHFTSTPLIPHPAAVSPTVSFLTDISEQAQFPMYSSFLEFISILFSMFSFFFFLKKQVFICSFFEEVLQ